MIEVFINTIFSVLGLIKMVSRSKWIFLKSI